MATELVDASKLDACCTAEANAIRAKTGSSSQIAYDWANSKGFADAIAAISGGGGVNVQTATGTFTGSGTNTQSITVPFDPDLIYVYSKLNDNPVQRGVIEILIVRDITSIIYTDASVGNTTSTGIYIIPATEMSGLNGDRSGKPYNNNDGNFGTGAVYNNGTLTITNYNGVNFYFYQQDYAYKLIKYTA